MKSSKNHRFSDDFKGNRSYLICLNSLNVRSQIPQPCLGVIYITRNKYFSSDGSQLVFTPKIIL